MHEKMKSILVVHWSLSGMSSFLLPSSTAIAFWSLDILSSFTAGVISRTAAATLVDCGRCSPWSDDARPFSSPVPVNVRLDVTAAAATAAELDIVRFISNAEAGRRTTGLLQRAIAGLEYSWSRTARYGITAYKAGQRWRSLTLFTLRLRRRESALIRSRKAIHAMSVTSYVTAGFDCRALRSVNERRWGEFLQTTRGS